jgi:hypothetical protein
MFVKYEIQFLINTNCRWPPLMSRMKCLKMSCYLPLTFTCSNFIKGDNNTNNNIIYNKLHTEQEVDEKKQGGQFTDM